MKPEHYSWTHIIATVIGAVVTAVASPVQGLISAHPLVSMVLGSAWAILGVFLKQPTAPTQ